MTKDEVLKLALDDLIAEYHMEQSSFAKRVDDIFKQARSAPVQEPLVTKTEKGIVLHVGWDDLPVGTKLYTTPPAQPALECTRSHPHENMDAMCELRTEIARLTNENARLKAHTAAEGLPEWMKPHPKCDEACLYQCTKGFVQFPECATQPAAWVELTDEDRRAVHNETFPHRSVMWHGADSYARAIEASLRGKNAQPADEPAYRAVKTVHEGKPVYVQESITDFKNRLAAAIEAMPFGDTAASFAVYIRNFK